MDIRMHKGGFALGSAIVASLLLALHGPAPAPHAAGQESLPLPEMTFDHAAALQGDLFFWGRSQCARCHVEPLVVDPDGERPAAASLGADVRADRTAELGQRSMALVDLPSDP